jgi:hypothetical protein
VLDFSSIILGGFQDDLTAVFGESVGWAIGHAIIVLGLGAIVIGVRERDHVINHSGIGRSEALDFGIFLLLTFALFFFYSSVSGFAFAPSLAVGAASALFLRWVVTILG